LTALVSAAVLAACGGGGGDAIPLPRITSVKVMGDSLADVGTFSFPNAAGALVKTKFTVQGTDSFIYPELIARSYGLTQHCNFYVFTGVTFAANTAQTGCTNFAIGGARINGATAGITAPDPRNIGVQLATAVAAANHTANDLLLIDGGGNDAADIVGLYLGTAAGGAAITAYSNALKTLLPAATVDATLATGAAGFASIGGTYMTALAGRFFDQIKANALDKGAKYVVVINVPGITKTPRFQTVLNGVAAANGGGATGAAARAQAEALFQGWITAFNTELDNKFKGNKSVLVVDVYSAFNDQVARPLAYGLTNVTTTACPATGVGGDGLPTYSFPDCTAEALSRLTPPAGATGGGSWWTTYAFSDSFHPTPYGHQLLANQIRTILFNNSWQ
jgi:outer membrane lipase/esterase